jgi:hypothetical protein
MKKLLIILFLAFISVNAQTPEIQGQAIFFPSQWDAYSQRVLNGYTIPDRNYDEVAKTIAWSAEFVNDVANGKDKGRWDNWWSATSRIPTQQLDEFATVYENHSGRNRSRGDSYYSADENVSERISIANLMMMAVHKGDQNFVDGSTYALVNSSRQMTWNGSLQTLESIRDQIAAAILIELKWLADSDNHDASNGGVLGGDSTYYDGTTRPTRTNTSHGTFQRYFYAPTTVWGSNGVRNDGMWWITSAVMSKNLHIYGSLKEVYGTNADFIAAESKISYWFKDWVYMYYVNHEYLTANQLGSNWRNFTANSFPGGSLYGGGGSGQTYGYYTNTNETGGVMGIMNQPINLFNNRQMDIVDFIHTYSTYFGDQFLIDYSFDLFKTHIILYVNENGVHGEFYRGGDGVPSHQYVHINMVQLISMSQVHAIGAISNFDNVSNPRKYYDYTSLEGTHEYFANDIAANTSDGVTPKGVLSVFDFVAKTWQPSANGGFRNVIYDIAGNGYPENKNNTNSISHGLANMYFDTPLQEAANIRDGRLNFVDGYSENSMGGFTSEAGQAWFVAGTLGGQIGSYDLGGVAETDIAAFEALGVLPTELQKKRGNKIFKAWKIGFKHRKNNHSGINKSF